MPWNVGVQDPNGQGNSTIASIEAEDISVVTSGLYERGFEQGGVFYYHILDPKTGYPAQTNLESSSITCTSSATADAYSTILFLMGHDAAMRLVESDNRFEACWWMMRERQRNRTVQPSSLKRTRRTQ